MFSFTKIGIELERDEIRRKYDGKWRISLKDDGKIFDEREDAENYLRSIGLEPKLDTKTQDGNYYQIHVV